jgi:molybdate transport system permease protein
MLILFGLPLVALALRAVANRGGLSLFSPAVADALTLSIGTTAISASLIVLLGTPLAYWLARYHFPLKPILSILVELPIVMPPVVAGLALLMTFGRRGLLGPPLEAAGIVLPFSTAAVVIAQVFVSAPYYIRTAQVRFQSIPVELEQAASIDGAGGLRLFWYVMLPLSRRGLVAGLALSWARALGEFGATILFAGNLQGRTQTMPLLVYGALERDLDAALWAGLVLIALAALALGLTRWLSRTMEDGSEPLAGGSA